MFLIPTENFQGVSPREAHGIYETLSVKLTNDARTSLVKFHNEWNFLEGGIWYLLGIENFLTVRLE